MRCPCCGTDISPADISEMTTLEDHGVCWSCQREIVNGYRCSQCWEQGHIWAECPELETE